MKEFDKKLSDFISIEIKNQSSSFVGVWKMGNSKDPSIIEPYWNLPINSMLADCVEEIDFNATACQDGLIRRVDFRDASSQWVFSFAPQEAPVEVQAALGQMGRQFAAMAFISELRNLLLRKRRLTYSTWAEPLSGRAKGKILLGETLKRHHARGRLDILECAAPVRTDNNRVNQVFRYTLRLCKRALGSLDPGTLGDIWARANFCEDVLSRVEELPSTRTSDYLPHGLNGFYKEHANLLKLANVVKSCHQEAIPINKKSDTVRTVPFLINTWWVFEKWIVSQARDAAKQKGWELNFNENKAIHRCLPDLCPDLVFSKKDKSKKRRILDCKYKKFWQLNRKIERREPDYKFWRADFHQVMAYKAGFEADRVGLVFPSDRLVSEKQRIEARLPGNSSFALLPVSVHQEIDTLRKNAITILQSFL